MNFNGVIEFVKYTLALTAACFVYSLEKLAGTAPAHPVYVLLLLGIFAIAALAGIFIFAASTAALHDKKDTDVLKKWISLAGYTHVGALALGVVLLSGTLAIRVYTDPPKPPPVYCEPAPAM